MVGTEQRLALEGAGRDGWSAQPATPHLATPHALPPRHPARPPTPACLCPLQTKRLGALAFGPSGDLFWLEGRPSEKGRQVLVRRPAGGGAAQQVTPPPESGTNVRTRVQEYGGGEYALGQGAVYYSNFA